MDNMYDVILYQIEKWLVLENCWGAKAIKHFSTMVLLENDIVIV